MTATADNNEEIRDRLLSVEHRLGTSEEILREMKDVIIDQHKTLVEVVKVQERLGSLEDKYKDTEKTVGELVRSSSKVTGIIAAAVFFLTIIQGIVSYVWVSENNTTNERLTNIEKQLIRDK